ncbi:hypothetical protein [Burkholderia sp. BCC1972]|uniref:hypothetical protein n=1 Tax=Burkholderia sp. BCC1972 TaxID=2817438 RepID=UPI002ABE9FF9|nr:hypothetical protein [Burkholderia sp. BCC1972]
MMNRVRVSIAVPVLMLATSVFAATPADNVAWSARTESMARKPLDCTNSPYSGWRITEDERPSTESVLKLVGTVVAVSALSIVGQGSMSAMSGCKVANGS